MNSPLIWVVAAAVVILAVWAIAAWVRSALSAMVERQAAALQTLVQNQSVMQGRMHGVESQVGQFAQLVTKQLGQVHTQLQGGLADSAKLASDAQKSVAAELRDSRAALTAINQSLGQFQEAGRELSQVSNALQTVLTGARTRGALGEVVLERMLEDALPQGHYELQYQFPSTGAKVDAVIRAGERLEKVVCVDSKFPREAYVRLVETGGDARKEFAQAVRKHAESIAEKYILPNEGTLDFALMFVPSESIYYEMLMTDEGKHGPLDAWCRGIRVFPVSPNTLHAYVRVILMGIRGLQMEENAKRLQKELAGLERMLESYADSFDKLGTHLRNAQKSYDEADARLARARGAVAQMAQGALPEGAAAAEPHQFTLESTERQ